MINGMFYVGFGCLFHWIFWGQMYYGLSSIAFVALWPLFVFVYCFVYIAVAAIVILIIWAIVNKLTDGRRPM